ncbi:hypothetical protein Hdeb2414_s0745g00942311 [Helianthus debilis subsp. tardiflorus]
MYYASDFMFRVYCWDFVLIITGIAPIVALRHVYRWSMDHQRPLAMMLIWACLDNLCCSRKSLSLISSKHSIMWLWP